MQWPGDGLVSDDVLEMSDRFDAIRSLDMLRAPHRWPYQRTLPLKREVPPHSGPGALFDSGYVTTGSDYYVAPIVYASDGSGSRTYPSLDAIIDDGWRCD